MIEQIASRLAHITISVICLIVGTCHAPDAYTICGKNPQDACLTWVDQCLKKAEKDGLDSGEAFEACSEEVDPTLVNWGDTPTWPL